jgi:PAS domain S-box-containing protein
MPVFGDIPDLIGRDFDEVIHVIWERGYADELVRLFRHTLETGEPYFAPERIEERRDRGVTEYYEWQVNRIPLPEGGYGVVCYFRDVSASVSARQKIAESEEKYRTLFESIDEGFCIVEVLFDGDEKPVDYRFLEVSPSFERQTGIANAAGRRIREIAPLHEEYWFEIYGKVALTGEPVRFENRAEQLHRWYDVYAFRVDEPRLGRVGILFKDITGRKQAEEALKGLNERLEQRVAERTVELTETNASLQAETAERLRAERGRAQVLRRLVMAQEDERRRIAREMHDQFGQQLTVLLLKLGMLKEDCGEQKGLREQVETLEEVARQLDEDVDFLVWELRPTALDDLGLQVALTNFAQNWSKHFGIPVDVLTHGVEKEFSTSEIDTVLYRIAQEALNNVAKHARAASVTILLEGRADAVSLIIEDDGVGFDAENTSGANDKGLGLVGIRERAALVGGTAEVESQPGEGTRVIVRIPAPPVAKRGDTHE